MTNDALIPWQEVDLYRVDGSQVRNLVERIALLREYRATNAIAGVYLVDPSALGDFDPWELDFVAPYSGPSLDEIEWADFPA
jgi:hypothetical protein